MQGVEELKSIHTLPSLLLYENGVLLHIVEGELFGTLHLVSADFTCKFEIIVLAADLPQKRPCKKLAAAIRQYLLHERGMHS